jgi:hypothetical protein
MAVAGTPVSLWQTFWLPESDLWQSLWLPETSDAGPALWEPMNPPEDEPDEPG